MYIPNPIFSYGTKKTSKVGKNAKPRPLGLVRYIVVHCTGTRFDHSYTPEMLAADHRRRGFLMPGYHFYIRKDGVIHPLRPLHLEGAHVLGHNHESIGVCYEGGVLANWMTADTRTERQHLALERLLIALLRRYPQVSIVGHRDLSPDQNGDGQIEPWEWVKACPCFDATREYLWLKELRRRERELEAEHGPYDYSPIPPQFLPDGMTEAMLLDGATAEAQGGAETEPEAVGQ